MVTSNPVGEKKPTSERGYKDWDRKRDVLKRLVFDAGTNKLMVIQVLQLKPGEGHRDPDVQKIVDSLDTWGRSRPYMEYGLRFQKELVARLQERGCAGSLNDIAYVLKSGTFEEFVKLFPESMRRRMINASGSYYSMLVDATEDMQRLAHEGFKTGRVDYKVYYGNPDSPSVWMRVTDAKNYHQYLECLDCIRQLTQHELWIRAFQSGDLDGIVMLGAGSEDKDQVLVHSIADLIGPNRTTRYTLVDYSYFMLHATRRQLGDYVAQRLPNSDVKIQPVKKDFLGFTAGDGEVRPTNKNVAWIIPGGTFGNLVDEHKFFASLRTLVVPGDLLVIAADTGEVGASKKYKIEEVRRFVEPALRQVWADLGVKSTLEAFMEKSISTETIPGVPAGHSKVPSTMTVEISVTLGGQKTVLLTSCRYQPEQLLRFVTSKGYTHRATIASSSNDKFMHFVFSATT